MDQDPAIFVIDLQDANKFFFLQVFLLNYYLKVHLRHLKKKSQNSRNQSFSFHFAY
jgi:hypothetical protein